MLSYVRSFGPDFQTIDYLMAEKERTKRQALGAVFRVVTEDVVL